MSNQKEKKKVVITGRMVLRVVAILAIVAMIVSDIIMAVGGTPISEILSNNPSMRIGALLPVFIVLLVGNEKKDKEKESESPKDE